MLYTTKNVRGQQQLRLHRQVTGGRASGKRLNDYTLKYKIAGSVANSNNEVFNGEGATDHMPDRAGLRLSKVRSNSLSSI